MKLSYCGTTKRLKEFPSTFNDIKTFVEKKFPQDKEHPPSAYQQNQSALKQSAIDDAVCFYEDSEGDKIILSEEEDFEAAKLYLKQHNYKTLTCSLFSQAQEDVALSQMETFKKDTSANKKLTGKKGELQKEAKVPKYLENHIRAMTRAHLDKALETQKTQHKQQHKQVNLPLKQDEVIKLEKVAAPAQRAPNNDLNDAKKPSMHQDGKNDKKLEVSSQSQKKIRFKNKMGLLASRSEIITKAQPGESISLKWTLKNNSKKEWPAYPLIRNFSQDLQVEDELVDTILFYKQEHQVTYNVKVPLDFKEKFFTLNLNLVDPVKKERFGEPMIAVIEVLPEFQSHNSCRSIEESKSSKDASLIEEYPDQDPHNKDRELIGNDCSNTLNYIDSIMQQFGQDEDDDFSMHSLDSMKYKTRDTGNSEEFKRIRELEELEKQKELKKFQDLVNQSIHEVKEKQNPFKDEEREKIERVKSLIESDSNHQIPDKKEEN